MRKQQQQDLSFASKRLADTSSSDTRALGELVGVVRPEATVSEQHSVPPPNRPARLAATPGKTAKESGPTVGCTIPADRAILPFSASMGVSTIGPVIDCCDGRKIPRKAAASNTYVAPVIAGVVRSVDKSSCDSMTTER